MLGVMDVSAFMLLLVCVCVRARESHVRKYEQAACPRQHNLARDGKAANHGSDFQIFHRVLEDTTRLGLHTEIRRIKF